MFFKEMLNVKHAHRGIFRTKLNIYDGAIFTSVKLYFKNVLNSIELPLHLECKYYDYAMKRKNQNKCYRARAVKLMIVFKNIYQIFCPVTLLKYMLIISQYVQQTIV